jgi:hypothetical protein
LPKGVLTGVSALPRFVTSVIQTTLDLQFFDPHPERLKPLPQFRQMLAYRRAGRLTVGLNTSQDASIMNLHLQLQRSQFRRSQSQSDLAALATQVLKCFTDPLNQPEVIERRTLSLFASRGGRPRLPELRNRMRLAVHGMRRVIGHDGIHDRRLRTR